MFRGIEFELIMSVFYSAEFRRNACPVHFLKTKSLGKSTANVHQNISDLVVQGAFSP